MRKQFGYGMLTVYALEKGMGRIMKRKSMGLAIFGMSVFLLFPHRQITYASQPEIMDEVNSEKDMEVDYGQDTGDFIIKNGRLVEYKGHDAKVEIPEGVTEIAYEVFMCNTDIVEVIIPKGVGSIGGFAFFGCTSLENVRLPEGLRYIGENAFEGDIKLTHLILPEGLEKIEMSAFFGCTSLEDVSMPESLHTIGDGAFANCKSLKSIDLSAVKIISNNAFSRTGADFSDLEHIPEMWGNAFRNGRYWEEYGSGENAFWIVDGILLSGQGCTGKVTIPDTVKKIAAYAFEGNNRITSVNIPGSVTEIGEGAFLNCGKLKWVRMEDSVLGVSIKTDAFVNCTQLCEIRLPNNTRKCEDGVFGRCNKLKTLTLPENITSFKNFDIPPSCEQITVPPGFDTFSENGTTVFYITDTERISQNAAWKKLMRSGKVKELALGDVELILHIGERYALRFNSNAKATWKSSRRSVAAVGITGNIYAKKPGTTVITATIYGKGYTCKVEVVEK